MNGKWESTPLPSGVYRKPDLSVRAGHPRVLVNEEELSRLRARLRHPENAVAYRTFRAAASAELGGGRLAPIDEASGKYYK